MFNKKLLLLIALLIPIICFSQANLKTLRKSSWQTQVYKIAAVKAEQYILWDSIPLKQFENEPPFVTYTSENFKEDSLPVGNYVAVYINENTIHTSLLNVSNLTLLTINNKHQLQLQVAYKNGAIVSNAKLFINNKIVEVNGTTKTFFVNQKRLDDVTVKIYTSNDTLFQYINKSERYFNPISK